MTAEENQFGTLRRRYLPVQPCCSGSKRRARGLGVVNMMARINLTRRKKLEQRHGESERTRYTDIAKNQDAEPLSCILSVDTRRTVFLSTSHSSSMLIKAT
jgi:hypothetical protein